MKHAILFFVGPITATLFSHSAAAQSSFWTATETTLRGSRLSDLADTTYLLPWDLEALKLRETRVARQWWTDDEGRDVTLAQPLVTEREPWMGPEPAPSEQLGAPPIRPQVPPPGAPLDLPLELQGGWTLTWSRRAPQQVYAKGDSSIAFTWGPCGSQWSVRAEERRFRRETMNGLCLEDWSYTMRSPLAGYVEGGLLAAPNLVVQPNPRNRQELELRVAGSTGIWPSAVRCVDAYGRLCTEQPPQGPLPLHWTPMSLTPGKYHLQIQLGNQTYSSSFIQH